VKDITVNEISAVAAVQPPVTETAVFGQKVK